MNEITDRTIEELFNFISYLFKKIEELEGIITKLQRDARERL